MFPAVRTSDNRDGIICHVPKCLRPTVVEVGPKAARTDPARKFRFVLGQQIDWIGTYFNQGKNLWSIFPERGDELFRSQTEDWESFKTEVGERLPSTFDKGVRNLNLTWVEITPAEKLAREQSRFDEVRRLMREHASKTKNVSNKESTPTKENQIGNHIYFMFSYSLTTYSNSNSAFHAYECYTSSVYDYGGS